MGACVNTLQGMMLQHQQRERSDSGETPIMWFVNSHLHDDIQQVKAELSARAQALRGITIDPTSFWVGWTAIILKGTNKKTYAITILAQPELHAT